MNHISGLKATKVHGYMDIDIEFGPGANILYGVNGSGKSTALRILASALSDGNSINWMEFNSIVVSISDGREISFERDGENVQHSTNGGDGQQTENVIFSTPITRLYSSDSLFKLTGILRDAAPSSPQHLTTMLCWHAAEKLRRTPVYEQFADAVRSVLSIDVTDVPGLYRMSPGQQNAISMLYSASLDDADILLIDEPETSLHIDIQQKLPEAIMSLMNEGQVVVATHSPEIFSALNMYKDATITELLI